MLQDANPLYCTRPPLLTHADQPGPGAHLPAAIIREKSAGTQIDASGVDNRI
jgi:hypothetical protein